MDDQIEGKSRQPGSTHVCPTICTIFNPVSHCGVDVHVKDGKIIRISGTKQAHSFGSPNR